MNIEDKILFEIFFDYQGLSAEEGDFYLDVLRHTKEITDSEYNMGNPKGTSYDLVTMSLKRLESGEVNFNGAICNDCENKWINGVMKKIGNRVYVTSEFTMLHPSFECTTYVVNDYFTFKDEYVLRKTLYPSSKYYETYMDKFSKVDMDEFILRKVKHAKGTF